MNAMTQSKPAPTPETSREDRCFLNPPVNIIEKKDSYVLEAEMPGVAKEGLEILLEDNQLTIIGHRSNPVPTGLEVVHRESRDLDFRRDFVLDPVIDSQHIQARIEQGLLTMTLPKTEAVKPRRIEVTG